MSTILTELSSWVETAFMFQIARRQGPFWVKQRHSNIFDEFFKLTQVPIRCVSRWVPTVVRAQKADINMPDYPSGTIEEKERVVRIKAPGMGMVRMGSGNRRLKSLNLRLGQSNAIFWNSRRIETAVAIHDFVL